MDFVIAEMISTATIAIALFGIAFALMQSQYSSVRRSFALFLVAVAVNNASDAFHRLTGPREEGFSQSIDLVIGLSSSLCLAPLFWMYVCTLTSRTGQGPPHMHRHLFLPILALLCGVLIVLSPSGLWAQSSPEDTLETFGWWNLLLVVVVVLQIAMYPQMAIYLFLIIRRMMRFRLMLRDVYASTEAHELRWIYVIGGLGALFWLVQAFVLILAFDPEQTSIPPAVVAIGGLAGLTLVATTILWGLRQRPPLVPDAEDTKQSGINSSQSKKQSSDKYEKSALSPEASKRIARKLRAAMEQDHLHRDPNLSLWALARHIGASPNYISQTLNEVVGESFFDFVNGYRIAEAKRLLSTTEGTVLTITYDVGFNARSSFYNAFKRVTGQTPTSYRKTMSHRDGMDDMTGNLRET